MPAYKSAFIKKAIDSILKQTSSDWELIIVDDCSPYHLDEIVSCYHDPRIKYYRNDVNIGGGGDLVKQWNHSVSFASGEWVVLPGDDDMYCPEFCEQVLRLIERYPQVDLIRTRFEVIDEEDRHIWSDGILPSFNDRDAYFQAWMNAKIMDCIGNYAFRRSTLMSINGFTEFPFAFGSDIATPIAMSKNGVAVSSEILFRFRESRIHLSNDRTKDIDKLRGITLMYTWFSQQDYLQAYQTTLHGKCVYDYFNLVIRYAKLPELPQKMKLCSLASSYEKLVMVLRWIKRKLIK